MWQVAPESKIQLVSCKLSPKQLLGISALEDMRVRDAYIFCDLLWSVLFPDTLLFGVENGWLNSQSIPTRYVNPETVHNSY